MASKDLLAERDKIQRQILALENSLGTDGNIADLLSSDSSDSESEDGESAVQGLGQNNLEAKRERVQREIEELENTLGSTSALAGVLQDSEKDSDSSDSDDDLNLPQDVETCLQMNLVYQEVLREKLVELEQFLAENQQQQKELEVQLSGPGNSNPFVRGVPPQKQFLGFFLKPYFKDKLTGLGPPANDETKERMKQADKTVNEIKIKRWEAWQKILLTSAVAKDTMKRMLQPKLSKMDYFVSKLSKAEPEEKEELKKQISLIEKQIAEISVMRDDQLMGHRNDDHDWDKISNIDFEGLRQADDLKRFWENYLHPTINKSLWQQEEIDNLGKIAEEYKCCHWDKIAEALGTNRTAFICFQTYQRYISKTFRRTQWTKDEDEILTELVGKMRTGNYIPYTQISHFMVGRDGPQLQYRWTSVLDPSIKKGPWSPDEDKLLQNAVKKYGTREWTKIRLEVPGRTDNSCRDRYLDCLREDVKKGPWSKEEIELLKEKVAKFGVGKWSKIASEIPNRVDGQCLHKWRHLTNSALMAKKRQFIDTDHQTQRKHRRKRRKVMKKNSNLKKESSSEDESEIQYMNSDTESDASMEKSLSPEPQLKEYMQPEMNRWIPANGTPVTLSRGTLRTVWVRFPTKEEELQKSKEDSAGDSIPSANTKCPNASPRLELNTVLNAFGYVERTYVGMSPIALISKAEHEKAYIKVNNTDVKLFIQMKAKEASVKRKEKGTSQGAKKKKKISQDARTLNYDLYKAISPWVGNVIISVHNNENALTEGNMVGRKATDISLQKTSVFKYFIKTFQLDVNGCRNAIKVQERIRVMNSAAVSNSWTESPKTVAEMLRYKQFLAEQRNSENPPQMVVQLNPPQTPGRRMISPSTFIITQPNTQGTIQPLAFQRLPFPSSPLNTASQIPVQLIQQTTPPQHPPTSTPSRPEDFVRSTNRVRKPSEKGQALMAETIAKNNKNESLKQNSGYMNVTLQTQPVIRVFSPKSLVQVPGRCSTPILPKMPNNANSTNPNSLSAQLVVASSQSPCVRTMSPQSNYVTNSALGPNIILQATAQVVSQTPNPLLQKAAPKSSDSPSGASIVGQNIALSTSSNVPTVFTVRPSPVTHSAMASKPCIPTKEQLNPRPQAKRPPAVVPPIISVSDPMTYLESLPSASVEFDTHMVFPDRSPEIDDWMNGKGGVVLHDLDKSLPYLPPSVATIKTLMTLLQVKQSLFTSAVKILPGEFRDKQGEEAQVNAIRKIVTERFASNPAYQLCKARFLSCFTLPAFLATIVPSEECVSYTDNEEEDNESVHVPTEETPLNMNEEEASAKDFLGIGVNPVKSQCQEK